jgi:flagellar assembly protein FliH
MESESMMIQMEAEVIKLSLEVASKILCRESQINPLFLAETARLSLQKIKATTELILHVAPENFSSWQQIMSASQEKATGLRIVEDQSVQAGMCFFKCGGSVLDLSLDTQLGEISHKFSELFASANPGHGLYDRIKA